MKKAFKSVLERCTLLVLVEYAQKHDIMRWCIENIPNRYMLDFRDTCNRKMDSNHYVWFADLDAKERFEKFYAGLPGKIKDIQETTRRRNEILSRLTREERRILGV